MLRRNWWRFFALLVALALVAAACAEGEDSVADPEDPADTGDEEPADPEDTGDGEAEEPGDEPSMGGDLIVGTTDTVVSMDPARIYDYYSSNIMFNAGQTLVGFAPGETEVTPMLAESVDVSDDGLTYTFTLREGVLFHDGSTFDSEDVKFSLERAINMAHPNGAAFLIGAIESIDTPDELTAVVTIAQPNITFLSRLAYTVATIIPSDGDYPAPDGPLEAEGDEAAAAADEYVHEDFVGTGPYMITDFREGESLTLEAFPDFWGDAPRNERVLVQFYQTSSQMKLALESGEIDIAFRDLSPDEKADLEGADGIQIVEGDGAFIRYIVINPFHEPFDDVNVRKAMAAAIDRARIVEDVFAGDAAPLYSMIPTGFAEYQPYFQDYEGQDPGEFIDEPVQVALHYGGERYGPTEPSLAQLIQRSLEETGLFEVELISTEWAQFTTEAWPGETGLYPVYLLGWYPDYFDADDYIEPFYSSTGFLGVYDNPTVDELIAAEQQQTDAASPERIEIFDEIQQVVADDAMLIPLYQGVPFVYAQDSVSGLEETMDPVQIFRYWLLSKSE
jgi:peptide/nickel transport system substrate-binding protein